MCCVVLCLQSTMMTQSFSTHFLMESKRNKKIQWWWKPLRIFYAPYTIHVELYGTEFYILGHVTLPFSSFCFCAIFLPPSGENFRFCLVGAFWFGSIFCGFVIRVFGLGIVWCRFQWELSHHSRWDGVMEGWWMVMASINKQQHIQSVTNETLDNHQATNTS